MSGILDIKLEGDGALKEWAELGFEIRHFTVERNDVMLTYLSNGMSSGKPSIGISILDRAKREIIVLEMSHAMLQTGAAAVRAKAETEGQWP